MHKSTFYRWCTVGHRGVVLESIQIGGVRCTSVEALQRFFDRLSGVGAGGLRTRTPSHSAETRRQERVEELLRRFGL